MLCLREECSFILGELRVVDERVGRIVVLGGMMSLFEQSIVSIVVVGLLNGEESSLVVVVTDAVVRI